MSDVERAMGRGAAWMVAARLAEKSIALINTVVLARLLSPDHFGVVAIAVSVVAALELMSAFSFDTVLIQKQDATRDYYDTVWTISLLFNGLYAVLLVALAQPTAAFYDDPRLVPAMLVIAMTRIIGGAANVGVVDFRKNLRFRREFAFRIVGKLVTVPITIIAAFWLGDFRALLIGLVAGALYSLFISYTWHPFRPRFSLGRISELFGEAKWLFIHNILYFINTRYADFVVAKFAGTGGLGIYNMANEFSSIPVTEMAAPVNRAAMPAYAKLRGDPRALESLYRKTVAGMVLVTFPAAIGIAVCSQAIVQVLLGQKWLIVGDLLPIFSLAGIPLVLANNNGVVLIALAESKWVALQSAVRAVLLLISLPLALMVWQIKGVAYAYILANLVFAPVSHWFLMRRTNIRAMDLLSPIVVPALCSGAMAVAVWFVGRLLGPTVIGLAAQIFTGVLVYSLGVWICWQVRGCPEGFESTVIARMRSLLGGHGTSGEA